MDSLLKFIAVKGYKLMKEVIDLSNNTIIYFIDNKTKP